MLAPVGIQTPRHAESRYSKNTGLRFGSQPTANTNNPDSGDKTIPVQPREITLTEFNVLNAVGVVGSLAAGIASGHVLLGILGMFVAPVPVLLGYAGVRKLMGHNLKMPNIRFSPGISWAGRHHNL